MQNKFNIVVIGGGIVDSIKNIDYFKNNNTMFYLWSNPFSLVGNKIENDFDKTPLTNIEFNKTFLNDLENYNADILIIESSTFTFPLYKYNDGIVTKTNSIEKFIGNANEVIEPRLFDDNKIADEIISLKNQLDKYFKNKKVVLISSKVNKYFLEDNTLKSSNTNDFNRKYEQVESAFLKIFNKSIYIDLSGIFLCKKPFASIVLDINQKYYNNILNNIESYKNNVISNLLKDDDVLYKIEFLNNFKTNEITKKYLEEIFDDSNFIDFIIRYSSLKFINSFKDNLITMNNFSNLKSHHYLNKCDSDFKNILLYFYEIFNKNLLVKYKNNLLAKYDIDLFFARQSVTYKILKEKFDNFYIDDITKENIDIIVKILKLSNKANKEELIRNVIPLRFDIWGSCYCRLLNNICPNDLRVGRYLFHVNPLTALDKKSNYDDNLFDTKMSWDDKMIKYQLDSNACEILKNKHSKWILVDFYTLLGDRQYYYNDKKIYGHICASFNKIKDSLIKRLHFDLQDYDSVWNKMDIFANFLKDIYGENIIVIANSFSQFYVDKDNKIKDFGDDPLLKNYEKNKNFYNKCLKYFITINNFYYIDIVDNYISTTQSLLNLSPSHFEEELYKEEVKIVNYIVKNRPQKKIYNKIDSELKFKRIMFHFNNNENNESFYKCFVKDDCDKFIFSHSYQEILDNYSKFNDLFKLKEELMEI